MLTRIRPERPRSSTKGIANPLGEESRSGSKWPENALVDRASPTTCGTPSSDEGRHRYEGSREQVHELTTGKRRPAPGVAALARQSDLT